MRFQNILVQITPRIENDPAITAAVGIAKRHASSLTLFDVVSDFSWPLRFLTGGWEQTIERIAHGERTRLEEQAKSLAENGIATSHVLAEGRLSVAIVRQVVSGNHDLVIKVVEGAGANRSGFFGSTDFRLLRKCPCPVLILKHDYEAGFQRVAVALDVMDEHPIQRSLDDRVGQAAGALCQGDLQLVYAMRPIQQSIHVDQADTDLISSEQLSKWISELAESAREKLNAAGNSLGVEPSDCHVLDGEAEEAIPDFIRAHDIDLLVMGTVARSGLDGLLIGNTADRILNDVECSVLALKPVTFVSPLADGTNATVS